MHNAEVLAVKQPVPDSQRSRRGTRPGWVTILLVLLVALVPAGPVITASQAVAYEGEPAPCFIAFVHGSGDNFHDEPMDSAAIRHYWSPDGSGAASFIDGVVNASWPRTCAVWRVGYDGNQSWWSDRAAGKVAASLHDFIDAYAIPDGAMTLIGHSMGGLVVRYVVNSGSPMAPFYNEYTWLDPRMDYDLVRRKTGRVLAVQAPLTGAQSADALFGRADNGVTNRGADLIKALGWRKATPATAVMTRAYLEAAGTIGGEMGDIGRTAPLDSIAGIEAAGGSGNGMSDDEKLELAWTLLCYRRGAANSWGATCQWDVWNFRNIAGDGLVERSSAHGLWQRGSPNGTAAILGARRPWLDVIHNHNHARYNVLAAEIRNLVTGHNERNRLGSYVGANLP
jgi:pimeloyl-ACP methyl ester carboxylesterase